MVHVWVKVYRLNDFVFQAFKRYDRPKLNLKIIDINEGLKKLCLQKGYDFIDNPNIGFRHLAKDKLHINKNGQRILTSNFLNHLKHCGTDGCSEVPGQFIKTYDSEGNNLELERGMVAKNQNSVLKRAWL